MIAACLMRFSTSAIVVSVLYKPIRLWLTSYTYSIRNNFDPHVEDVDGVIGTLDTSSCVFSHLIALLSGRTTYSKTRV